MAEKETVTPEKDDGISKADFNAYKSKSDARDAKLNAEIKRLGGELADKETQLAELKVVGDDPEAIEALRKEHVELTKKFNKTTKELNEANAELTKTQVGAARSKVAASYKFKELEIDEGILAECETEADMELVAAKAQISKLEAVPKAPEKEKFESEKLTGVGGEDDSKLSARQLFAAHLEEKEEK